MTQPIRALDESLKLTKTSSPERPVAYGPATTSAPTTDPKPCIVIELNLEQRPHPLPAGYTPIDQIAAEFDSAPDTKHAMARARRWLAKYKDEGTTLRTLRLKKGWSQATLGARVGMAQPHIARLENGKCDAQMSTVLRLADALGVKPRSLFEILLQKLTPKVRRS
jgi:DNA-binding XRE family transcriptional regulator